MDVVLTFTNAPPSDDPPTAQEIAHLECIVAKAHFRNNLPDYIDEMLLGFNGIYADRVPDTFLDLANKYMRWSDISPDYERQQRRIDMYVRTADNGNRNLRRLYAFWLERCSGKITNDARCCVILRTIHRMCVEWALEQDTYLIVDKWIPLSKFITKDLGRKDGIKKVKMLGVPMILHYLYANRTGKRLDVCHPNNSYHAKRSPLRQKHAHQNVWQT